MRLSDLKQVGAQETRRDASTTRRKIGSGAPEGLGTDRPHCGAVAGKSTHAPMT
jgi:hypothetical protein